MALKLQGCYRCCFCVPLRYGLIIWGYITLIIHFVFMVWEIQTVNEILKQYKPGDILYESCVLLIMIADLVFLIMFVVAAHMKHLKLLKISFISNIISLLVNIAFTVYEIWYCASMLHVLYRLSSNDYSAIEPFIWTIVGLSAASFIEIGMKCYIMFLLKKEIKKLESNRGLFSFVNNATEAKCKMACAVEKKSGMFKQFNIEDEEKGEEDTFNKVTEEEGIIEVTHKKGTSDYSLGNMNEKICRVAYEEAVAHEESELLVNEFSEFNNNTTY